MRYPLLFLNYTFIILTSTLQLLEVPVNNMTNRFRWEGRGAGLGLLKSDNSYETLHVKEYWKIRAEFPI